MESETFVEAVVHDLKNPLTSVMGCLSCLLNDSPGPQTRKRLLKLALRSCRSQLELLDTLIDAARLESGDLQLQLRPLDAGALLQRCRADVRAVAANLGVFVGGTSQGLPALDADGDLLRRALLHLLASALKHTPRGGRVCLDGEYRAGAFVLAVSETGAEVSAEQAAIFFDKRRDNGMGLYFCRLAVKAHGGRISLDRLPGGARVTILLPQAGRI